ncbi:MAG: PQQ-dependent sugar dehydrogenase [Meiothermus sp.]|nr:PQQ-dependent sugar dehydrogenase [Meiothermus sp.]
MFRSSARLFVLPAILLAACNLVEPLPGFGPVNPQPNQVLLPSSPQNLSAQALSSRQIRLRWDASERATRYAVEQLGADSVYSPPREIEATELTLEELAPDTTYIFRVRAGNNSGFSEGSEVSVRTPRVPIEAPAAPQNLSAEPLSSRQIALRWEASPGAGRYVVERQNPGLGFTQVTEVSNTQLTVEDLTPGTRYAFRVKAANEFGESGWAEASAATPEAPQAPPQAPPAPQGLSAEVLSSSQARLSWEASPGATHYTVERRSGEGPFTKIADQPAPPYTVEGLSASTAYTFRVRAGNEVGYGEGAEVNLTTPAPPLQPPAPPANLRSANLTATSAELSWDAMPEAQSFNLERGLGDSPTEWTNVTLPSATMTRYPDTNLRPATTYTYRLRARNAAGPGAWATHTLTTRSAPTPPPPGPARFRTETIVQSAGDIPWSLNFAPDGRLLFTTRNHPTLRVQSLDLATRQITSFTSSIQVRVGTAGYNEGGSLGMELDPDFATNRRAYICYSYWRNGVQTEENRFVRVSRVELSVTGTSLINEQVMLEGINGTNIHKGCRVIHKDGKLYISTGDANNTSGSQNPSTLSGKILRINLDGTVPADNPDWDRNPATNSPVWSMGHRNPQGLAFQPGTGLLWSTEHGPYTRDELNIIRPGRNYDWPDCIGEQRFGQAMTSPEWGSTLYHPCNTTANLTAQNYQPAVREYNPDRAIAISDMVFYPGDSEVFPQWRDNLLFVSLMTGRLYRLVLNGEAIAQQEILIDNPNERLRDIAVGPDGFLYISSDSGRIFRVVPQ